MTTWLPLVLYAAGYAWAFRFMLGIARRAYADRTSELWHIGGERLDGLGAGLLSLGVVLVPLAWPLLAVGRWAWSLITAGRPS